MKIYSRILCRLIFGTHAAFFAKKTSKLATTKNHKIANLLCFLLSTEPLYTTTHQSPPHCGNIIYNTYIRTILSLIVSSDQNDSPRLHCITVTLCVLGAFIGSRGVFLQLPLSGEFGGEWTWGEGF